jgi:hypothetical protein
MIDDLKKFGFLIVKNSTIRSQIKQANKIFNNQFKKKICKQSIN